MADHPPEQSGEEQRRGMGRDGEPDAGESHHHYRRRIARPHPPVDPGGPLGTANPAPPPANGATSAEPARTPSEAGPSVPPLALPSRAGRFPTVARVPRAVGVNLDSLTLAPPGRPPRRITGWLYQ